MRGLARAYESSQKRPMFREGHGRRAPGRPTTRQHPPPSNLRRQGSREPSLWTRDRLLLGSRKAGAAGTGEVFAGRAARGSHAGGIGGSVGVDAERDLRDEPVPD